VPVAPSIELQGMQALQRWAETRVRALQGNRVLAAMRNSVLMVERQAKINSPVDTGRLRASITPDVGIGEGNAVEGIVGTNVEYAPWVEFREAKHAVGQSHYLGDAYLQSMQYIREQLGEAVGEILSELHE